MNHSEFQLRGVSDQRLAIYATSRLPAWLWSIDGTRVLWANPVGARLFGTANSTALARKIFGPADPHRRQVAQLANRLPASGALRLQRLRGLVQWRWQATGGGVAIQRMHLTQPFIHRRRTSTRPSVPSAISSTKSNASHFPVRRPGSKSRSLFLCKDVSKLWTKFIFVQGSCYAKHLK